MLQPDQVSDVKDR